MSAAFGLAFDLRRVTQAGAALTWTLLVSMGVVGLLSWRIEGQLLSPEGVAGAWYLISHAPLTPLSAFVWSCVMCGWWVGFAYLCAPVQRSAAMDIARDERDRNPSIPQLNRQAALVPLMVLILPGLCLLLLMLWSLLTYIPGIAGGVVVGLSLPIVLMVVVFGAAFLVVGAASAPLMGPAAVIEGRDHLEALSRAMSYVMQRPGRYFAYLAAKLGVMAASLAVGAATLAVLWGMVGGALWLVGQGDLARHAVQEAAANGAGTFEASPAAFAIGVVFWSSIFVLAAWWMVVGLSCDVLTYMLMRYRVDGVTFDKITVAEEQLDKLKTAVETAAEAEAARQRHDAEQAESSESAA
ncbi:MAG: hypothetical protein KDB82_13195 [Planctomycetes bacterium]|nr:hypothetical protein [Planctomycetota bacterium]